jgi:pimeloyl-ACP methyl ester carboxylesterase
VWWLIGLRPVIYTFGWEEGELTQKMAGLSLFIDSFSDDVYLVGVSAGGTAAVSTLLTDKKVRGVVTISSPYRGLPTRITPLLVAAIKNISSLALKPQRCNKILSLHGVWDQVVPTQLSSPRGIVHKTVPGFSHSSSIAIAMLFYPLHIKRFFKNV